ncbi:hypothetical protein WR25_15818 [Diploscapter pachys]|uniref:Uncharacterized protein n=1 Tax=Diploscapter pachys TaxID=2018661 RepID=A0A2A2JZ34_9BILA|nr:hypothetical protein WR25_15818 [Diploscapter pachys]
MLARGASETAPSRLGRFRETADGRKAHRTRLQLDIVAERALHRALDVLPGALGLLRLALIRQLLVIGRVADRFLGAAHELVARRFRLVSELAHRVTPLQHNIRQSRRGVARFRFQPPALPDGPGCNGEEREGGG